MAPLIHVGYQKTASTFLQHTVFSNEEIFFTPWNILSAEAIDHFVLRHPQRFNPSLIRNELKAPEGLIPVVSHENLLGYPIFGRYHAQPAARRIAETFPDAKILVCIREQRSILLSNYIQYIRQGGNLKLHNMLTNNRERPGYRPLLRLDHFEYDLTYSILREFFDDSQILMLPYELLRADHQAFMKKLGDFAGADLSALRPAKAVHVRPGATAVRLEHFLNGIIKNPSPLPEHYKDYPIAVRARTKLVKWVDALSKNTPLNKNFFKSLEQEIESHVDNYFDISNARTSNLTGFDLSAYGYRAASSASQ